MDNEPFETKRIEAQQGGGAAQIEKQHAKGKHTARERIELLLDAGSFHEVDLFVTHRSTGVGMDASHPYTDGVITGWGKIDGRQVYVYAQDFTIMGGSLGESQGKKIAKVMELAYRAGVPLIGLNDSGGARIQEGVDALEAYSRIFWLNSRASGVIPQLSVIMGPCAGGAVYSPAITDFVFMVDKTAYMFITGPEVIKSVTHEQVDAETLGGSAVHSQRSGVAHFSAPDEETALGQVRALLAYLPANNLTPPPYLAPVDEPERKTPELATLVPEDPQRAYDVHNILHEVVDDGEFLEVQEAFAPNLVVGFARLDGYPVGIIANQPDVLAGVLDLDASDKGARFIRFCDAFHFPLLTLVDTPGFLPGTDQEYGGIIRHGAKLAYAYAEASVPKVTLILRKAYGGGYIVMGSKNLQVDLNFAWPKAELAVMGPEGAVQILYRKELAASEDAEAKRAELTAAYREQFATPFEAAAHGYLDDIFEPAETRSRLIAAFESLREKRVETPARKHGNIPL